MSGSRPTFPTSITLLIDRLTAASLFECEPKLPRSSGRLDSQLKQLPTVALQQITSTHSFMNAGAIPNTGIPIRVARFVSWRQELMRQANTQPHSGARQRSGGNPITPYVVNIYVASLKRRMN